VSRENTNGRWENREEDPMDVLENTHQAAQLIRAYFPQAARRLHERTIEDFAKVACFLERPERVAVELQKLETGLRARFAQKFGKEFDPNPKAYLPPDGTKKVLTSYLNEWDARFGFNSLGNTTAVTFPVDFQEQQISVASGPNAPARGIEDLRRVLPTGRTPTITGFAAPPLFRLALLRLGYHWKDPGAGEVHGDITHRLQWFAITSAFDELGISVTPLYLFQKLASPETWNPEFHAPYSTGSAGRALWDFICDCFTEGQPNDVGPTCNPASYRSPVSLQRDLTSSSRLSADLPLLRRIITRKKFQMAAKLSRAGARAAIAVIDYTGRDKTVEMDGSVAFYVKPPA
jgi:uncharacterized protein DUF5636